MRVTEISGTDPLLDGVYPDILVPSFPADELITASTFREGLASGRFLVAVIQDGAGPMAAAVVERFPEADVLLLLYLAVRPGLRGNGSGTGLLSWVRDECFPRSGAAALLAELEHPAAHPVDPGHGDPAARLRFYARHGGRAVDIPYFQPALGPDGRRVYGLVLTVLAQRDRPPDTIATEVIRRFLVSNIEECEGQVGDDPDSVALWRRLDGTDRLPLLPLDDPARLPLSAPAD